MSKTVKTILIVVLCLAIIGGIAGVIAWTQSDKFDQKDLSYVGKYEVGGLDSSGNYMSTNASIYTKKPIECQGLNCNLVFDSIISYQLYFYDQNNEFVHTTGKLTGTFVEEGVPFFAKYVRIVITPNDDDKVTSLEVGKYAKQLNVSVNREQGFKNYTENLFEILKSDTALKHEDGTEYEQVGKHVSNFMNVAPYNESLMFRDINILGNSHIYFYDATKTCLGWNSVSNVASNVFVSSEGITYYSVPFNNLSTYEGGKISSPVSFIRIEVGNTNHVEVVCR